MAKINIILRNAILMFIPYNLIWVFKKCLNINYLYFGKAQKDIGKYLHEKKTVLPDLDKNVLGEKSYIGMKQCSDAYESRENFLREYVLESKDCAIEPKFGWAIDLKFNKLIFDSIPYNSWIESYHPSAIYYLINVKNAKNYEKVVSIRMIRGGANNYWHFFHDLIGQVYLAKKFNLDSLPFLISLDLYRQPYFKQALDLSPYLKKINWVVHSDLIKVKIAYFIQVKINGIEQFNFMRSIFPNSFLYNQKYEYIYLKRNNNRLRHIKNNDEIELIAKKNKFTVIDADNLSLLEQILLFSQANIIISPHGAGLTNIVFSDYKKLTIIEIFPGNYIMPHYYWLAKQLNITYRAVVANNLENNSAFRVDPVLFEETISKIIKG